MNEVTRNLWIGDFPSALNTQQLRKHKIHTILSVMRGKLTINETFIRHQIELDDTQEADILSQFLPAVHIISRELERGRGVLVHCQAGISRSPTIVAAYLIYTRNITPDEALGIILEQRPFVQPNTNFCRQLDLFHKSQGTVSTKDKDIRRFYLEKTVQEIIMSGDGSESRPTRLSTEMLSSFPNLPGSDTRSVSNPTASTSLRQRRIRCKMCRQDLATREHMLDHGQLNSSLSDHGTTTSQNIETGCEGESNATPVAGILPVSADPPIPPTNHSPPTTSSARSIDPPSDIASDLQSSRESSQPDSTHTTAPPAALVNPKCSGYFVEPMKWMDHFLSTGSLAGKIICPNKKCNAKLGNYDWAGVCCGCKIWVTPGFCINRSKVDEVV